MIKRYLLFLILFSFKLFAIDLAMKNNLDGLVNKEVAVAVAINSFIEQRGSLPTDIADLKNKNYLDSDFDDTNLVNGNSIVFTISNKRIIEIDTNITSSDLTVSEKDYYLNNIIDTSFSRESFEDTNLKARFYLTPKTINTLIASNTPSIDFIGTKEPTTFNTVSSNDIWFDSNYKSFNLKKYDLGWGTTDTFNQNLKTDNSFENINSITLTNLYKVFNEVNVNENAQPPQCPSGETYNSKKNRCEAYTSNPCSGLLYDSATDSCYKRPIDYCVANGYPFYDNNTNQCWKYEYANKITTTVTTSATLSGSTQAGYNYAHRMAIVGLRRSGNSLNFYCGSTSLNSGIQNDGTNLCGTINVSDGVTTTTICPSGFDEYGSSTQCRRPSYSSTTVPFSWNGLTFSNSSVSGADAYIKTPSCSGRNMPVNPFYPTPHYGNNGVCYSDVGLYCKNTGGISWDGLYTCWDSKQTCPDTSFNFIYDFSGTNDKCNKFEYSCPVNVSRYGLAEHKTETNATLLFNRISNKEIKANNYLTEIANGTNINVNDNNGAMCIEQGESTFVQPNISNTYNINGIKKSGF